jgi:hypothetical protein
MTELIVLGKGRGRQTVGVLGMAPNKRRSRLFLSHHLSHRQQPLFEVIASSSSQWRSTLS